MALFLAGFEPLTALTKAWKGVASQGIQSTSDSGGGQTLPMRFSQRGVASQGDRAPQVAAAVAYATGEGSCTGSRAA
jgi:hypothetical protein